MFEILNKQNELKASLHELSAVIGDPTGYLLILYLNIRRL